MLTNRFINEFDYWFNVEIDPTQPILLLNLKLLTDTISIIYYPLIVIVNNRP